MNPLLFGISISCLATLSFSLAFAWHSHAPRMHWVAPILAIPPASGVILQAVVTLLVVLGIVDPKLTYIDALLTSQGSIVSLIFANILGPIVLAAIFAFIPTVTAVTIFWRSASQSC